MPKAADLTGDALNPTKVVTPTAAVRPRSPAMAKPEPEPEPQTEKLVPLQVQVTEQERRDIKAYAAKRGITLRQLILSYIHEKMNEQ